MDLALSKQDRDLQAHARAFTERFLIPYELENETNGGGLSKKSLRTIQRTVLEWKLNAINHLKEDGGQGYTVLQQALIRKEPGKATGALWDIVWLPAYSLRFGTPEQKREYLIPSNLGKPRCEMRGGVHWPLRLRTQVCGSGSLPS